MRILAVIGALAILTALAVAGLVFGGFYNVTANAEDPPLVHWALERVRMASIRHHATASAPFKLDEPQAIRSGAQAFARLGCANCHGAPGVEWAKFSEGMRPDPPDLKDVVPNRSPEELFWVVTNGINMTGMPSFSRAGASDQELWTVVAFLKQLPKVTEADFKEWTRAGSQP